MTQTISKGISQLRQEADNVIETIQAEEAEELLRAQKAILIDVRDQDERERNGVIPHSVHIPRGMLEFKIDPSTPVSSRVFSEYEHFIFYCATGWRSAFAAKTAHDMGISHTYNLKGGIARWKEEGHQIESPI
ncbi:rhodanese-like domain-containing protein [Vibrio sp. RE88]|uniref:rhodanese-like domain-containing protein n=1 Tax=Vibrio sp. RE88 TaxID=2607610 RepID=UPI0014935891|nr:rhodanese-like domain-containing protein [Vibrio sp. RE88]NOH63077.1 rhodanese-like domain-containing protein [Vibrio sp. RE88]